MASDAAWLRLERGQCQYVIRAPRQFSGRRRRIPSPHACEDDYGQPDDRRPASPAPPAPAFDLPGTDGKRHTLDVGPRRERHRRDVHLQPLSVREGGGRQDRRATWRELAQHGVGSIAIMSNDPAAYPEDSFDSMKAFAAQHAFTFPYVIDETQDVARAYGAVCTPDFFGFDRDLQLVYRGRLDASGRSADPTATRELFDAMRRRRAHGQRVRRPASVGRLLDQVEAGLAVTRSRNARSASSTTSGCSAISACPQSGIVTTFASGSAVDQALGILRRRHDVARAEDHERRAADLRRAARRPRA